MIREGYRWRRTEGRALTGRGCCIDPALHLYAENLSKRGLARLTERPGFINGRGSGERTKFFARIGLLAALARSMPNADGPGSGRGPCASCGGV